MLKLNVISGKLLLMTGLHIGGADAGVKIGGIDNPVIKNPITKLPYIPGSSLKGKIRFLLEHYYGLASSGEVSTLKTKTTSAIDWSDKSRNEIAVLFGCLPDNRDTSVVFPTRVVFRDSNIIGATTNGLSTDSIESDIGILVDRMNSKFVEGKVEVAIDRLKGTAKGGALRQVERVPAGTVFEFEVVLRAFEEKDLSGKAEGGNNHIEIIKKGLKLLENDALGGYGSRGSGRIKLFDLKIGDTPFSLSDVTL
ncbi:MAG: type III-A CRISPR-associated RAMP protein Csm3 [Candidatus Cloacimonas sp.]|jgi:CRISPR-associated protein Csm3|nr:type III-A CRISPR-associated RAMP protein Csm3 [Candidatus Cloacimonas sp.]